jgi:hypothetical protein
MKLRSQINKIEIVTFEQFLSFIPRYNVKRSEEFPTNTIIFTRILNPEFIESQEYNPKGELQGIERAEVHLYNKFHSGGLSRIITHELLCQCTLVDISNKGLNEEVHHAIDQYSYSRGLPTHLVRVANRLWMVSNPDDFLIPVTEDGRIGFFSRDPNLNTVYSIHKGEPKTFKILGCN